MAETPQVNQSQVFDDLTSLQQDTPKIGSEARADSQISSPESGRPDSPSLYNSDTKPNNNQNDLTSQRKESELTTSEISSNPRRAENNYRENLSGDPGQLQSNPQDQFTVSNQNIQETRNPIEGNNVRQSNPGVNVPTNAPSQIGRSEDSQQQNSNQNISETVSQQTQTLEQTQPTVTQGTTPIPVSPLVTSPTPTIPTIQTPQEPQQVLPNVTVDIEVDPGAKLLKGTWSYADTVTVTVTGSDGSVREFVATINPDGTWTVDVSDVEFDEDVIYTATATATNDAGSDIDSDSDSYDIPEPPPPPPVEVSRETVNEVNTEVTVGDPRTETTFIDNEFCRADTENNKTIETTIRTWTDTTTTTTTFTQTSTPVTTIKYSNGTTEVIRGETTITQESTDDVSVATREEVISTDIEDPIIEVVWNEMVSSVTNAPTKTTEFISENTVRTEDDENDRWVDTTTKIYKDTITTDTITTTTRTPTYTIIYCDGTVETEIGISITTTATSTTIETITYSEITNISYEPYPESEKEHQDNGWGNGDDTSPGNSADNNNAENNTSDKTDPTENNNGQDNGNPKDDTTTDGQNPGNDKPVGDSPWDGETGDSGNPGNGQPQDTIDNNTNNPPGNPAGTNDTIDPFSQLEFNLDNFLPNGNKITESNLSDWVRLVEESDGSALLQVDKHEGRRGESSGWTDVIDIPNAAGKEAFFDSKTQTVDFVNDPGDWHVNHEHPPV